MNIDINITAFLAMCVGKMFFIFPCQTQMCVSQVQYMQVIVALFKKSVSGKWMPPSEF